MEWSQLEKVSGSVRAYGSYIAAPALFPVTFVIWLATCAHQRHHYLSILGRNSFGLKSCHLPWRCSG